MGSVKCPNLPATPLFKFQSVCFFFFFFFFWGGGGSYAINVSMARIRDFVLISSCFFSTN